MFRARKIGRGPGASSVDALLDDRHGDRNLRQVLDEPKLVEGPNRGAIDQEALRSAERRSNAMRIARCTIRAVYGHGTARDVRHQVIDRASSLLGHKSD